MATTITCPAEFYGKPIGTKFGALQFDADGKAETDDEDIIDTFRQVAGNDPRFKVGPPPQPQTDSNGGNGGQTETKTEKPAKGGKGKPAEKPPFDGGKVVKAE